MKAIQFIIICTTIFFAVKIYAAESVIVYDSEAKLRQARGLTGHDFDKHTVILASEVTPSDCKGKRFITVGEESYHKISKLCQDSEYIAVTPRLSILSTSLAKQNRQKTIKLNLKMAAANYEKIAFVYSNNEEMEAYKSCNAIKNKDFLAIQVKSPADFAKTTGRLTSIVDATVIAVNPNIFKSKMLKIASRVSVKNSSPIFGGASEDSINDGVVAGHYLSFADNRKTIHNFLNGEKVGEPLVVYRQNELLMKFMGITLVGVDYAIFFSSSS